MNEPRISEAFMAVADLCLALDDAPLTKHEGCWEHQVDDHWWIAVNGHQEPRLMQKHPTLEPLKPFHAFVEWNGWPAGLMTPTGGCIAAGACANEETFIAALRAARDAVGKKGDV